MGNNWGANIYGHIHLILDNLYECHMGLQLIGSHDFFVYLRHCSSSSTSSNQLISNNISTSAHSVANFIQ